MTQINDYDVIIIGAGISGLVCGCYLAEAGMKTLIVEKNSKPGGYCTSFNKQGFYFDACVHSLGSLRGDGNLRIILKELKLEERLKITRHDPSDIIIAPEFKINFWNNLNNTIHEFQNIFPQEAVKIKEFFIFMSKCKGIDFISLRSSSFNMLLERYFENKKLKEVLSFPLLGNAGLPADKISALTGILIYKEFMFDGGYYPEGSIQALPDVLTERFKEFGGNIYLSNPACKIRINNTKVEGIETKKNGFISSKYVVSNADATQTLQTLIDGEQISSSILDKLKSLTPSLSMFILYLGMDNKFYDKNYLLPNTNIWYLPYYNTGKMYNLAYQENVDDLNCFLIRLLSDHKSVIVLIFAPFINEEYWKTNKMRLIDLFIKKVELKFPQLSSHIKYKDAATPNTLFKWTMNYKGASYGWAGIPSQLAVSGFTQRTNFENLYLTGHWTTLVQGVSGVAYLGRDTSKKIINKELR